MIEFFDTETINDRTVLICNSEKYLWNSTGLSYTDCFDFLINNSKKYNYFFRIDYDVNMIIKNLPKKNIIELFETNETQIKKYRLKYYRHKIFVINNKKFYDIANFFKTSLIKTIEILNIDLSGEEKKFVELMKSQRSNFKLKDKNKIIKYSLLENLLGIKIVNKIYSLIPDELKTYSLYGSSSLANKFLNAKNFKGNYLFNNEIFESAYFGGRMECFKIGTFKDVYKYDINSAYPDIIRKLKEPLKYEIKNYNNEEIVDEYIYQVEFNHKKINSIGTLPVRLKNGYLVFPKNGKGYYYGVELKQAIKRKVEVKISNVIQIEFGKNLFHGEIETYYNLRKELKKKNDLRNLIYKILLNSIYGKFAQQVGLAQYQNLYLAGLITASVRAKLLEATYNKDNDIIFFATDGILTKSKLKVKVNYDLGNYELIPIKKAIVILSGIYKLIDYNNKIYMGERGFRVDFDECYRQIKSKGYYDVFMNLFISNIYAFKNHREFLNKRCKFTQIKKRIDITQQHKRIFESFNIDKENNSILLNQINIEKINKLPDLDLLNLFNFDDFDIL